MGLVARKPVFGISVKASFKPVSLVRDLLENLNFKCSKYGTFQKANNKGADQTAGMCLCCLQNPEDRFSHVEVHM